MSFRVSNNMEFTCQLSDFVAWAPNIEGDEQWQAWSREPFVPDLLNEKGKPLAPALKTVPAMQRRRLSYNSKLAMQCALMVLPVDEETGECAQLPAVFASPQGELHKTLSLLDSLRLEEPVSPMGFSLSVHNTAAGLYSIHTGNKAQSSSVAAQEDTLLAGLIEAYLLSSKTCQPVLFVFSEEALPEQWLTFSECDVFPHAFACLLRAPSVAQAQNTGSGLNISIKNYATSMNAKPNGLSFIAWMHGDEKNCVLWGEQPVVLEKIA